MKPLAVVDHIFPAGFFYLGTGCFQLLQGGEGSLVRKIVLARIHRPQAKGPAFRGDGGAGNQVHLRIGQNLFFCRGDLYLGIGLGEGCCLGRVTVIHPLQGGTRFQQAVYHSIDMPMV
ncbi:hypothetical protein D3C75_1113200 [compost metagenome]